MRFRSCVTLLLLLIAFACGGCFHSPSNEQRLASFREVMGDPLSAHALRASMLGRTVFVLSGHVRPVKTQNDQPALIIDGSWGYGTGVLLSSDGYVLTAAHCAMGRRAYVGMAEGSEPRVVEARIVWRGLNSSSKLDPERDIALLKLPASGAAALDWNAGLDVRTGSPVIGAGYQQVDGITRLTFAGGHISSMWDLDASQGEPKGRFVIIEHDAPLKHGDSGGPLLSPDGRLLAINVGAMARLFAPTIYIAIRPDPEWIEQVIAEDRASHAGGVLSDSWAPPRQWVLLHSNSSR